MKTTHDLKQTLQRIDGRGYKAYRDIQEVYKFPDFSLSVDHVQGDPFAAPSRISISVSHERAGFPFTLRETHLRRTALGDYLSRSFNRAIGHHTFKKRGIGKSGLIQIDHGGQEVLERNCVLISDLDLEVRFTMGLPAAGRRILAREAEEMFFQEIPAIVESALFYNNLDPKAVQTHVEVIEDQDMLRKQLAPDGIVTFIANGSILPRHSGVDDRPLDRNQQKVVPFESPPELEIELDRPNQGKIRGMGIPAGVTLIVGGGYHGKTTLLKSVERGIYNHVPGDGRENVVTIDSAVKIRAEDGRYIEKVDISPFINDLPFGKETTRFSTENASGSTSQAANIIEALEIGTDLLLIDEDTSATNFIIRDARMQALVRKDKEPITPFIDRVAQLYNELKVSTIMVMGGSGDYFDVADQIIMMNAYQPVCVTQAARKVVERYPTKRQAEGRGSLRMDLNRVPVPESFDASRGRKQIKVDVRGLKTILFGKTPIDLSALEQLVDSSQTRAIAEAIIRFSLVWAKRGVSLREGLLELDDLIEDRGLDSLKQYKVGNLARPRLQEIAFAVNRLRTLKVQS